MGNSPSTRPSSAPPTRSSRNGTLSGEAVRTATGTLRQVVMQAIQQGGPMGGAMPAPEQMKHRIALLTAQADAMRAMQAAARPLHGALSTEQKRTADALIEEHLRGVGGGMGMRAGDADQGDRQHPGAGRAGSACCSPPPRRRRSQRRSPPPRPASRSGGSTGGCCEGWVRHMPAAGFRSPSARSRTCNWSRRPTASPRAVVLPHRPRGRLRRRGPRPAAPASGAS